MPRKSSACVRRWGDDGRQQNVIKTVHGRGYRFVADVASTSTAAAEEADHSAQELVRSGNLGYERTPLFGRDHELRRCHEAFDDYRLVTLLGIGGTGKTRLAKAFGRSVREEYPDGVWFIDLVPVRDEAGIYTAISAVLGVRIGTGDARAQLAKAIGQREMLIILDNCEHIEDDVAAVLDYFLENTATPRFLATSRDPIDLADELRFFVDPLSVHSTTGTSPAVALFVEVAQRHGLAHESLDLSTVEQICARLDGLPLAIELAAAQLKHLTLTELLERLDRRFDLLAGRQRTGDSRQDSLAEVVEATWLLLNAQEQRLLGQLAVFPGQFTMTDIEEVFGDEMSEGISFAMSRLVELCLLNRTSRKGAWWRLLETVRLYALNQLSEDERDENAQRHAIWVRTRLGTYPEDNLHNYASAQWASDHYADITAAEKYFSEHGDLDSAISVCTATGLMVQLDEGGRALAKLERINEYLEQTDDVLNLVKLHGIAALCAQVTSNPPLIAHHAAINLELSRQLTDPARLVGALILSSLMHNFRDQDLAQAELEEAVAIAEQSGDQGSKDLATSYLAWSYTLKHDYDQSLRLALEVAERNLDDNRPLDNPTYSAVCNVIACTCLTDPQRANTWTDRLLTFPQAHALWGGTALFAAARAAAGRLEEAAELCLAIAARLERMGVDPWPDMFVPLAVMAQAHGDTRFAQALLRALRRDGQLIQTFHCISVYRQLRNNIGFGEEDQYDDLSRTELGEQAMQWLQQFYT